MESHLYLLWQVDIRSSVRNDLTICKEYNVQPSELRCLPYFQYEWILDDIRDDQKKMKERHEEEERNRNLKTPKMPGMPKIPKISVPKFR